MLFPSAYCIIMLTHEAQNVGKSAKIIKKKYIKILYHLVKLLEYVLGRANCIERTERQEIEPRKMAF